LTVITIAEEFVDPILRGRKVTTIRRGFRKYPIGPGVMRSGAFDIPVDITDVQFKTFHDLTQADAIRDGLSTIEALKSTLYRFYPDLSGNDTFTIVEFHTK